MTHWLDGIALVDGHHHFWDLSRFPYRWLAPDAPTARFGDKASISKNFLPQHYLAEFGAFPLSASVHVQANCGATDPVEETRWLQELSYLSGWPTAIVAEVDLSEKDAGARIADHLKSPAVRGIRTPVAWDKEGRWRVANRPAVLSESGFRAVLPRLEAHGLCLECVVVPSQLAEIADLADAHPGLTIVVNHFATLEPDQPGNVREWQLGITGLREMENVFVKLSGLWTVDKNWQVEALRPHVTHLLSCLGPKRLLYGSNLPVESVNCPLSLQFERLRQLLAHLPRTALRSIFSDTARHVYRLPAAD